MESRRVTGLICLVVVLVATAGVSAAHRLDAAESFALTATNSSDTFIGDSLQTASASDWPLESVGRQLTDPACTPSPLHQNTSPGANTLPAVPAAITMTICGFLCISFVRDRRAWLAMIAGILWLGQTGIAAVPQLTQRICSRIQTSSPTGRQRPNTFFVTDDEITGNGMSTRFIGLLRRLQGIPGHNHGSILVDLSFPRRRESTNGSHALSSLAVVGKSNPAGRQQVSAHKASEPSQALAVEAAQPEPRIVCPVRAAGQFILFSPAFIFQNLSRGPPLLSLA